MSSSSVTGREKVMMQVFVSLFLLAAGLAVLTAPNFFFDHEVSDSVRCTAVGWIGAVIGYWLA